MAVILAACRVTDLMRAVLKYFFDVNFINLPFSAIIGFTSGFHWFLISLMSFGLVIGVFGYHFFKNNEYYMYYNLGYTKKKLFYFVWAINFLMVIFLFLLASIFS